MRKISFVVPCYRSEQTLKKVVEEIVETVKLREHYDYEIILVNDNSPDNVWDVISKLCKDNEKIKGVSLAKNFGQHAALMAGYRYCRGELVFSLDDDGQTPVNEMFALVDKLDNEQLDVVFASYYDKKHSKFRNFGTYINRIMAEVMLGKPKNIKVSSFFVMKAFIAQEMLGYKNPYPYDLGLICRITKRLGDVEAHHRERSEGKSGYNFKSLIALWMNGFTAFSILPLRVATVCGAIFSCLGFMYGIYILVMKLIDANRQVGWSSMMCMMLLIGGIIMLMLGMIGEYIGRIYISINNSPQYVIREKYNLE